MIAMDANFGLVRKMSAGASLSPEHPASQFFCQQEDVDRFVQDYGAQAPESVRQLNPMSIVA